VAHVVFLITGDFSPSHDSFGCLSALIPHTLHAVGYFTPCSRWAIPLIFPSAPLLYPIFLYPSTVLSSIRFYFCPSVSLHDSFFQLYRTLTGLRCRHHGEESQSTDLMQWYFVNIGTFIKSSRESDTVGEFLQPLGVGRAIPGDRSLDGGSL